jgi:hypothetical protein
MRVRNCSIVALVLALACGGKSNGGGAGGATGGNPNGGNPNAGSAGSPGVSSSGTVTEMQFQEQAPALFCGALQNCCEQAGVTFSPLACQLFTPQLTGSSGSTFHPDAAASCLQLLQNAMSCDSSDMPTPCTQAYTGSKALGAMCSSNAECAPQTDGEVECDVFDQVCKVVKRGELGDSCNASCEELADLGGYGCGIYENAALSPNEKVQCYRNDGLSCGAELTCQALVPSGESCVSDQDCVDGDYCDRSGTDPVCAPLLPVGDPCSAFGGQCVSTAYCDATGMCAASKPDGEACSGISNECQGQCSNGACAPQGDLSAGFLALFCGGGLPTQP